MVDLSVRTKYHVSVLATKKDGQIFPLPHPKHVFAPEESIMVMGTIEDVRRIT